MIPSHTKVKTISQLTRSLAAWMTLGNFVHFIHHTNGLSIPAASFDNEGKLCRR